MSYSLSSSKGFRKGIIQALGGYIGEYYRREY